VAAGSETVGTLYVVFRRSLSKSAWIGLISSAATRALPAEPLAGNETSTATATTAGSTSARERARATGHNLSIEPH
jgi:hypothetical protein